MKIIIRTQHLRQRAWPLLPKGDSRWIDYFNEFLGYFEVSTTKIHEARSPTRPYSLHRWFFVTHCGSAYPMSAQESS